MMHAHPAAPTKQHISHCQQPAVVASRRHHSVSITISQAKNRIFKQIIVKKPNIQLKANYNNN
jgi:hypothetical protein